MKKLAFLFLFSSTLGFTQNWAPAGAKWYIDIWNMPPNPTHGYIYIEATIDTVILGVNCRKLEKTFYAANGNVSDYGFDYMYSDSNKVYHWLNNSFYTLYDFSVVAGDTLILPSASGIGCNDTIIKMVVDSTGITTVGSQNLRTLYVSTINNTCSFLNPLIEKIGSMGGIFPFGYAWLDVNIPFLRCYEDSTLYFTNINWPCDTLVTSAFELQSAKNLFDFYPNPVSSEINIIALHGNTGIELFNLSGECVLSRGFRDNHRPVISVKHLPNGVYFMKISSQNNFSFKKIIISH